MSMKRKVYTGFIHSCNSGPEVIPYMHKYKHVYKVIVASDTQLHEVVGFFCSEQEIFQTNFSKCYKKKCNKNYQTEGTVVWFQPLSSQLAWMLKNVPRKILNHVCISIAIIINIKKQFL